MNADGKRGRERSINRWLHTIENDIKVAGVCIGDLKYQNHWRS